MLTEDEAARLARAVDKFRAPQSLIILEAIQAGLRAGDHARTQRRRRTVVYFRLPTETKEQLRRTAHELGVSQQTLIRHLLAAYLTNLKQEVE